MTYNLQPFEDMELVADKRTGFGMTWRADDGTEVLLPLNTILRFDNPLRFNNELGQEQSVPPDFMVLGTGMKNAPVLRPMMDGSTAPTIPLGALCNAQKCRITHLPCPERVSLGIWSGRQKALAGKPPPAKVIYLVPRPAH